MSQYKNIIWRPDFNKADGMLCQLRPSRFFVPEMLANIHFMIGYCPQSIEAYQEMANELRKTFPDATDDEINCHQITESSRCKMFTLITYNARIEYKDYEGWDVVERPDYSY